MRSERYRLHLWMIANRLTYLGGGAEPAPLGQRAEPAGNVHAIAGDLVSDTHHVAYVNAEVEIELRFLCQCVQDRQCATDGFESTGEDREALVATHLDRLAAKPLDQRLNQLPVSMAYAKAAALVAGHQRRVANHIREENGREASVR